MKKLFAAFAVLLLAIALLVPQPAFAQALFPTPKDFTVTRACNAVRSIRKGSEPVALNVGETYPALGTNKTREASHAYINVNGDRKWVALNCGTFDDSTSVPTPPQPEPTPTHKTRTPTPDRTRSPIASRPQEMRILLAT